MQKFKPLFVVAPFVLTTALGAALGSGALAHDDHHSGKDSIRVTIVVDGKEHDVTIDDDGVEVDGKRLEDIEVTIEVDGDITSVIDEILDEVEEALEEVDEAIEEVRVETGTD